MESATTIAIQNATSGEVNEESLSEAVNYILTIISCVLIGSFLVPARKFFTGDGVFFQLMMNNAIMVTGLVANIFLEVPKFEPFVLISGVMWCSANLGTILVLRCVGLGIGMNMVSLVNLVTGWASGRFGFFAPPQVPRIEWLQYLGIALACFRGVLAASITPRPRKSPQSEAATDAETGAGTGTVLAGQGQSSDLATSNNSGDLVASNKSSMGFTLTAIRRLSVTLTSTSYAYQSGDANADSTPQLQTGQYSALAETRPTNDPTTVVTKKKGDFFDRLSLVQRRVLGVSIAIFCGVGFGLQFEPMNIMKMNGGSLSDRDYTLSFYSGAFLCSMVFSIIYILAKHNRPFVDGRIILPALVGGLMWAVGTVGRLVTQEMLTLSIAFPIYTAVPSMVNLAWSFFYFREIRGRKNVILFINVAVLTVASVLMVSFSK